ncbi:cobalt ECF transporter T component CbiQ [Azonexus sp.]|jgi:cobalt/nickel transport system permease protein|uniref:cobalt ECF transporter T component CbiQ n=1 Tax=Azonexus sp. TaxID=1872668 RepID=UPI0035B3C7A6
MLIEQAAYANRWRRVNPQAKACFALAGLLAAFAAASPEAALRVAFLSGLITCLGAGVPGRLYLRVATPAAGFLALSCLNLLIAVDSDFAWRWAPEAMPQIAALAGRSLAALAALLGLVLTTPLADLIALLRRLRCPAVLLDLMVLCYRMLFVFSQAVRDTHTAQQARLGYATTRHRLRSLGYLAANLAVQVWQRSHALHLAALARNGDGALRFLGPHFAHTGRDTALAMLAGFLLILLARLWV